jgi:phenylglyoxylate dehydrogenase epsilon subunit
MANRKHLIIGCGTAGLSGAQEIRRINSEDKIKIVTAEDYPPYSPTVLPYLLSGSIDEASVPMKKEDYFDKLGASLAKGRAVARLLPEAKEIVYSNGERESFDTLLLATGAEPVYPPIKGLEKIGTMGFHTIEDCKRLIKQISDKKDVAVLGAGLVGMELAIGLVERGCRVAIIEKEPRLLPLYFDPDAESLIRSIFLNHGVQLFAGLEVTEIRQKDGKVEISLSEERIMHTDVLVNCAGVAPRTAFVEGSGISVNKGILVDKRMRTNIPGIYAAGDVAEAPDFFTGKHGMNQIIESAVDQGRIAGSNMAGETAEYEGWISCNIFSFFGQTAFSAGLSMPSGEGYEILSDKNEGSMQFKKLVYQGMRLVGAMFMNVELDPGVILYLIRNKVDLRGYKQQLFEQPLDFGRWLMLESEEGSIGHV